MVIFTEVLFHMTNMICHHAIADSKQFSDLRFIFALLVKLPRAFCRKGAPIFVHGAPTPNSNPYRLQFIGPEDAHLFEPFCLSFFLTNTVQYRFLHHFLTCCFSFTLFYAWSVKSCFLCSKTSLKVGPSGWFTSGPPSVHCQGALSPWQWTYILSR